MAGHRPPTEERRETNARPTSVYREEEGLNELEWHERQKDCWYGVSGFAAAGLLLAMLQNELEWYKVGAEPRGRLCIELIKCACVGMTAAALYYLYMYYDAMVRVRKAKGSLFGDSFLQGLVDSRLLGWCIFDACVLLPQPIPFVHWEIPVSNGLDKDVFWYDSDLILTSAMFLRFLFVPRLISAYSVLRTEVGHRASRFFGCQVDTWMIMRVTFTRDLPTLMALTIALSSAGAYVLLLFERPFYAQDPGKGELDEFEDCVWVILVVITSVGYGDVAPHTRLGRAVVALFSLFSVLLIGIIFNLIVNLVSLAHEEKRIVDTVLRSQHSGDAKEAAATVVQMCFRQYMKNVRALLAGRKNVGVRHHPEIRQALTKFRHRSRVAKQARMVDSPMVLTIRSLQANMAALERSIARAHESLVPGGGGGRPKRE